jgi:hypothetical protein
MEDINKASRVNLEKLDTKMLNFMPPRAEKKQMWLTHEGFY